MSVNPSLLSQEVASEANPAARMATTRSRRRASGDQENRELIIQRRRPFLASRNTRPAMRTAGRATRSVGSTTMDEVPINDATADSVSSAAHGLVLMAMNQTPVISIEARITTNGRLMTRPTPTASRSGKKANPAKSDSFPVMRPGHSCLSTWSLIKSNATAARMRASVRARTAVTAGLVTADPFATRREGASTASMSTDRRVYGTS